MMVEARAALGQLSERVSLLEREQGEGECQRDDVEDALQAVDDFRIEVAGKLREKFELPSAAESLSARLEALVGKTSKPTTLELPDKQAGVLVEMPVTPDADSIKSGDPRSRLIVEVSESTDDGGAAAEDVEKEYSISVPVTPMLSAQQVCPSVTQDAPTITLESPTVSQVGDDEEAEVGTSHADKNNVHSGVPHVRELPVIVPEDDRSSDDHGHPEVPHVTELPILLPEVTEVPIGDRARTGSRDDIVSSETTETTSAGEREESSLPSSCLPSDREAGKKSFLTEAVSDEGSSSVPSDFRAPMMMKVAKAEAEADLPIFKALLEEGDVEFNITADAKAERLWKEPGEDLGLLDLDWEKDLLGDDEEQQHFPGDNTADNAFDLDEAFQRLSPGISDDDAAAPQEPKNATSKENPHRDSPSVPDSSSHAQGTTRSL